MKFSIIIPVYRVEKYLAQCVESILVQTCNDYEIILVDDGSPDNCPEICDRYASEHSKIKVVHKSNEGLSMARNDGMKVATGQYIIFLDSDDYWQNQNALQEIDRVISKENPDILIIGLSKFVTGDDAHLDTRIPVRLPSQTSQLMKTDMQNNNYIASAWDKVIKSEFIRNNNLEFVKGQLSEDIEWCCKILLNNPSISILSKPVYMYRQQVSTSISSNISEKNINHFYDIIRRYVVVEKNIPLRHFLANQYVILLTNLMRLPRNRRKAYLSDLKSLWWLLEYDWYPYVKRVSKLKFLGFTSIIYMLKLYYLLKRV